MATNNAKKKIFTEYKETLLAILISVIIIGVPLYLSQYFEKEEQLNNSADGFTIERYNVVLDVKRNNKIDVTENITINFTNAYKHGIYKFTPKWLKYTGKDNKTIKRKANILYYRAEGDPYQLDTVNGKARIKIGSKYYYVGEGEKNYTIKYTYDMGKDPFKNFDELIFHAYGDYWGTEIKNASIQINMPKNIEGYNVNFFTDKYRKNNVNDVIDYYINGNTLYATFNANKNYKKQFSKYCDEKTNRINNINCDEDSFKYLYEPLNKSLTVDIELPEGYFVGGSWNYGWISFTISFIIFLLTAYTILKWIKYGKNYAKQARTLEFYPPDDLNAAEIGYIFNERQANKKLTIALIVQLASKGYIKIDDLKNDIQITNLFSNNQKTDTSKTNMLALSDMEKTVYDKLFETSDDIIISKHKTLYEVFNSIEKKLDGSFKDKIRDKQSKNQIVGAIIRNILILILSIVSYRYIEDLDPNWSILYLLSFVCIFINLFFTIFMNRKTRYGEMISARVKGFRNFLITAEKPRLEALVNENPKYFYNILPYTYAMNISKKWIKKFENIPIPKMDMGTFNYGSDHSYYTLYHDVSFPKPVHKSSGHSSSSSCGGGCSSCGGGCSSCGGGGSW